MSIPGVTLSRYAVCLLHGWHLGPIPALVGTILWFLVDEHPWGEVPAWLEIADVRSLALMHIKSELKRHYSEFRRESPDSVCVCARVGDCIWSAHARLRDGGYKSLW